MLVHVNETRGGKIVAAYICDPADLPSRLDGAPSRREGNSRVWLGTRSDGTVTRVSCPRVEGDIDQALSAWL